MRLGETRDPKELIPGHPALIEEQSDSLRDISSKLEGAGDRLKRIDFGEWSGAASESFRDHFSREPVKWIKCADGAEKAAAELVKYSEVLRWAQAQAAQAIELWEQGRSGSNARNRDNGPRTRGRSVGGEQSRAEARAVLKRAQDQLEEAGRRAAKAIGKQDGAAALALMLDAVAQDADSSGKGETKGPDATASASVDPNSRLAQAKAGAQWVSAGAEGSVLSKWGMARGNAEAGVDATAAASAEMGKRSLAGQAEASAGARASAEGQAASGPAEAHGKANALAGGSAGANAKVGASGVNADAAAFAGGKVGAEGGADIGGIGVTGSAEGWAGAGAQAGFELGMNDEGNFEVSTNVGAAVGLGGSLGGGIEIDPDKVADTVGDAADAVGDAWNGAGESVQQTMSGWL